MALFTFAIINTINNIMRLTPVNLFISQVVAHIATIYWLFSDYFTVENFLLVILVYFFTGCIGMSITYHRLLTHKSFTTYKFIEYFGTFCATVGLTGSSLSWTATHRLHHSNADKPKDPHSPLTLGYIKAQWFSMFSPINIVRSPVLKSSFHRFFHKNYFYINAVWAALLYLLGGFWAVLILYLVPACLLWNAGSLINTLCHTSWCGYKRYKLVDSSINNPILGVFMWGEGWHNNHHKNQGHYKLGECWWEVDIGSYIIKAIKV